MTPGRRVTIGTTPPRTSKIPRYHHPRTSLDAHNDETIRLSPQSPNTNRKLRKKGEDTWNRLYRQGTESSRYHKEDSNMPSHYRSLLQTLSPLKQNRLR
eukprot:CAMPEP_0194155032 /NCGR_PEP_ID=MMETSP0152-20130528/62940_1 /TAXON_ID=1049557 /ORGANISM="Thalassiothrix antarctica, Strain L6-D1" /LENGTH=98 /DNA_ID=CAMNT_0038861583 /DNA_START=176 /DNA_END=469 /DNA_ORIENTATION=+